MGFLVGIATCAVLLTLVAASFSPTAPIDDRDVYYPGTEALAPDEMRVVALGTGMPSPRPKQAAACWLVELGNRDKLLFDIGAGCHERLAAQKIPYDLLDKVFIGHLRRERGVVTAPRSAAPRPAPPDSHSGDSRS